jgi:formate dehydrogenase major subunit
MAEAHPVGFQWVMEAKRRGATIIHVDPRYTRTSAVADIHVPIRAGTDIAFLGGIINHILSNGREFREYVVNYTNAAVIVDEAFGDTEDLDGLFSGFDAATGTYDTATWQYEGMEAAPSAGQREMGSEQTGGEDSGGRSGGDTGGETEAGGGHEHGLHGGGLEHGDPPSIDPTLEHPRCVFQLLKKHYRRYTPAMVERVCGIPQELFLRVCEELCENSGRERTGAFAYAVGWTHHTVGVQYIRTAAIVQTLLGNMGRPGGGILALRGHASIQGSTDIPTLYNILPGYIPMPHAKEYASLTDYVTSNSAPAGYWGHMDAYVVSLLKAWFGDAATADNDFCFDYLPRISGDHSVYQSVFDMLEHKVTGFFLWGQNPVVGSVNGRLHRMAMAELEWLVVRDFYEIESASFWYDAPEIETGELRTTDIRTEVFLLPAAAHVEKDGSFTNTQRLLQWHDKAIEPAGDRRSDLWFAYHLGRRIREKLFTAADGSRIAREDVDQIDLPLYDLTWEYPTQSSAARPDIDEPDAEAVLAEINGWDVDGRPLDGYTQLKADGSTACGCWIYCGCYADGVNQTRRRTPGDQQSWVAPEWAWAWPDNRRILYNRASADPEGRPWSQRKAYVWWDVETEQWTGHDTPDFTSGMAPDYDPPDDADAEWALTGRDAFIMQADGKAWLYVPNGLKDGPLPTHYEPHESPVENPLYDQQANPARQQMPRHDNPYNPSAAMEGADAYPYVMTTYRITEHHTAGGMSRWVPHLSELQPEMFCEVSPELAAERGLTNGGWATIVSARTAIEAKVLVTDRMPPLRVDGRTIHQVGLPYHWGGRGISTGDAANDLFPIVLDPNVHIQETKAASCDIRPGRRPRGPALREFVEAYPRIDHGDGPGNIQRAHEGAGHPTSYSIERGYA